MTTPFLSNPHVGKEPESARRRKPSIGAAPFRSPISAALGLFSRDAGDRVEMFFESQRKIAEHNPLFQLLGFMGGTDPVQMASGPVGKTVKALGKIEQAVFNVDEALQALKGRIARGERGTRPTGLIGKVTPDDALWLEGKLEEFTPGIDLAYEDWIAHRADQLRKAPLGERLLDIGGVARKNREGRIKEALETIEEWETELLRTQRTNVFGGRLPSAREISEERTAAFNRLLERLGGRSSVPRGWDYP